jgi:hypothetical protein
MPRQHVGPALTALIVTLTVSACGGDDDPVAPGPQVPTTVEIANAELTFTTAAQTEQLQVTVRDQSGDVIDAPDLDFVVPPDDQSVASVSETGLVLGLGNGTATIHVRAGDATAEASLEVDIVPVELENGVAVIDLAGPPAGQQFFSLDVPEGDGTPRVLQVRLLGGTGDADLGVRFGARPDLQNVDCASPSEPNSLDNLELCVIVDPAPGTHHFIVLGYETFTGVALEARLVERIVLNAGTPLTNLTADRLDLMYFDLTVPSGSGFSLRTTDGTGDPDLFATSGGAISLPQLGGLPCASLQDGPVENCQVAGGTQERWTVVLLAYDAFEGITLTAEVAASEVSRADR